MKNFWNEVWNEVRENPIRFLLIILCTGAWIYWMIWFVPHSQFGVGGSSPHWEFILHGILEIILPAIVGFIILAMWTDLGNPYSVNLFALVFMVMVVVFVVGVILWGVNYNSTLVQKEITIQLLDLDLEHPFNVINKFDEVTVVYCGTGAGGIANIQIDESLSQFTQEKLERVFFIISTDPDPNSEMSHKSSPTSKHKHHGDIRQEDLDAVTTSTPQ